MTIALSAALCDGQPKQQLVWMKAIELAFGRRWEMNTIAAEGVRVVITHALPYFPAMAVYAVLVKDGDEEWVELLDIVVDHDYFNLIEDDPS